jgi:hypothetical protein
MVRCILPCRKSFTLVLAVVIAVWMLTGTLTPCRIADTRNTAGPLGGPSLGGAGHAVVSDPGKHVRPAVQRASLLLKLPPFQKVRQWDS